MQLHRDRDKFEQAGANLVVVGQGTPAHAKHFRKTQDVDIPLLVDPDRRTYKAVGAKVGTLGELLGPRVVLKGALTGKRQGKHVGNPAQLGGVLVIDTDGRVTWAHMADDASDNPPNEDVLEAVRQIAAPA
jgi:peroxiredoxin